MFWTFICVCVFLIIVLGVIHLDEFLDHVFDVLLGEDNG